MPNTTRAQITPENQSFYDRNLLERALPELVHTLFAQVRDIPRKAGTSTIKFRKYSSLAAATTPLSEGVTPVSEQISITEITATVLQYGTFVVITDVIDYESVDSTVMEIGELQGEQAGDTIDQLTRDILCAGTSVTYGGDAAQRTDLTTGDVFTVTLLKAVVLTLKNSNAKKIKRMVDPSTGVGTAALDASFVAINHTNLTSTIRGFAGIVEVRNYPSKKDVMPGEYGYCENVRFIETTNAKVFTAGGASSVDVYPVIIMGANAYGTSKISGEALKNIIKPIGAGDDPLNQRATIGWKMTFVAKILNNDFIHRVEVTLA
jgi:N4-gp56 family major capsid protein